MSAGTAGLQIEGLLGQLGGVGLEGLIGQGFADAQGDALVLSVNLGDLDLDLFFWPSTGGSPSTA